MFDVIILCNMYEEGSRYISSTWKAFSDCVTNNNQGKLTCRLIDYQQLLNSGAIGYGGSWSFLVNNMFDRFGKVSCNALLLASPDLDIILSARQINEVRHKLSIPVVSLYKPTQLPVDGVGNMINPLKLTNTNVFTPLSATIKINNNPPKFAFIQTDYSEDIPQILSQIDMNIDIYVLPGDHHYYNTIYNNGAHDIIITTSKNKWEVAACNRPQICIDNDDGTRMNIEQIAKMIRETNTDAVLNDLIIDTNTKHRKALEIASDAYILRLMDKILKETNSNS